ncbi:DDB1- and CUL4-associated factor 8 isoform X2 [Pectinophora gossypiella]|nr:DDB1- and CUL4-associated factor 8 isoform X2 [Pectinophora gossypiella]
MEDNSSSDDEIKDSPLSPKLGASSSKGEKDENVDSGVSADKSESTSSEDRGVGTEGPSNEVVNVAPSSSNIRTILLNIRRPKRGRNYRKRKTPDRDSDSNDSSRDSDDLSAEESAQESRQANNSNSDAESEDMQRFMATFSDGSPSNSSNTSSDDASYVSDDMVHMQSGDTDSDEEAVWNRSNEDNDENDEDKMKPPSVLTKPRPKHNYLMLRELINREMGLTFPAGKTTKNDVLFEQKFYGSLHVVYRLKKLHQLCKHKGCVNSINFHPEGHLLASGSDDTNVVVWDWARNAALQTIKTGHKSNVFQSKFLYLNARSQLNIVTCARDGQVRLLQCPPSGGASVSRRRLASHSRAAHKLHVCAAEPHLVVSAGEDGLVMQCDVRAEHASRLFQVKDEMVTIPLYSVCGHPLDPRELLVAGRDKFVRVYDRRKSSKPVATYCPSTFEQHNGNAKKKVRLSMMHLTCAVYNHDGSEILGSYNDEDIYLFDAKNDVIDKENPTEKEGYTHRYSGHRNSATFKGVAFFGPRSQYVVSGSDCSYIYIWEKNSESIVQWMKGDFNGVVNCIEAHPRCPVLATSGLDKDVKIWIPKNHKEPTYEGLGKVVRENVVSQLRSPLFNDFLPTLYNAWRGENRVFTDEDGAPAYGSNIEFDGNVCTAF